MSREDIVLEASGLSKIYGSGESAVRAIGDLTFSVRRGELCCIVGPSGCGKTTLLRLLSGLLEPTTGVAWFRGKEIDGPSPGVAVVFQDYSRSLLPWLTVEKNVTLPLRRKRLGRAQEAELAREALVAVGLGHTAKRYPWQLSGGMQQRVAIARALAYQPEVMLMDEPFASVDAQTRVDLEDLLLRVWQAFGITIVFVTHDIDEAVYLSDRIVALTPSPSVIKAVVDVDLPRPRDQIETKELPDFAHIRANVYRLVKRADETLADPERLEELHALDVHAHQ